jgi:hypothetical protein
VPNGALIPEQKHTKETKKNPIHFVVWWVVSRCHTTLERNAGSRLASINPKFKL